MCIVPLTALERRNFNIWKLEKIEMDASFIVSESQYVHQVTGQANRVQMDRDCRKCLLRILSDLSSLNASIANSGEEYDPDFWQRADRAVDEAMDALDIIRVASTEFYFRDFVEDGLKVLGVVIVTVLLGIAATAHDEKRPQPVPTEITLMGTGVGLFLVFFAGPLSRLGLFLAPHIAAGLSWTALGLYRAMTLALHHVLAVLDRLARPAVHNKRLHQVDEVKGTV